jgi:hypothetical protein
MFLIPVGIFKLHATAVKQNAQRYSRFIDRVAFMMNRTRKSAASVIGRTIGGNSSGRIPPAPTGSATTRSTTRLATTHRP